MAGVDAGSVYSSIRIRLAQLDQDLKGVYSRLDALEGRIKKSTDSEPVQKNFNLMSLAGTAAFIAIGNEVKKSIQQFAQFEQSIANVASVAGGSADEMAKLEQAAREAGETTRFTASQAADALYYLASAGLDATQSVDALDGVLKLAGATQSDLAYTSTTVTSALSQFSLEASDSSRVANVFAAAIGNSQATMDKLANAMRYIGPVAGAFGRSIEETTGALQVLFNAGFQGEQAGTILRNVFADLANETGPVMEKLSALGVRFEDVDPTVNSFSDSIRALEKSGITASQAIAAFGDRAGPGLVTLLKAGGDKIDDMTAAVTGTNQATEAYAIQNDTLAGSLDRLKSVSEEFRISVGEGLNPTLRAIIDTLVGFIGVVNKIPAPVKAMAAVMVTTILGVNGLAAAIAALGITINVALGPIALIAGAIGAIVVGVKAMADANIENLNVQFADLSEKVGLTAQEIKEIQVSLERGSFGGMTDAAEQVRILSENLGIAQSKIIEIGLAGENVSEAYKDQLRELKKQVDIQEEQQRLEQKSLDFSDDFIGRAKEREEAEKRANKIIEDRNKLKEQEDLKEIERTKGVVEARKKAQETYQKDIAITSKLQEDQILTVKEALQKQLSAAEKLVTSLYEIGYSGKLTQESWTDATGKIVTGVQEGNKTIREMSDTIIPGLRAQIEELDKQEEKQKETRTDSLDVLAEYQQKLFDLNATEEQALAAQEEAAISAAEKLEAADYVVNSIKDSIRKYFAAVRESRKETIVFGNVTQEEFNNIVQNTDKITNSILNVFASLQSGGDVVGAIGASFTTLSDVAEQSGTEIGTALSNILGPAGLALQIIQTIIGLFEQAQKAAIDHAQTIANLSNQIAQQALENRKKLLDFEYEAEKANIDRIRDAKVEAARSALDEELEMMLINLGIIEATTTQKYDAIYQDILDTAEESGKILTQEELDNIQAILTAQQEADEASAAAEKAYKQALAKWDYDKAVADKEAAIMNAKINKERALSELSWWDIYIEHRDRDIKKLFNQLIGTIQSTPLPPVPSFQFGGIVPGNAYNGDKILTRQNSGEMNISTDQQAALWDFIRGGSQGGSKTMTVIIELNGRQIAENTAKWVDDGKVRFKAVSR